MSWAQACAAALIEGLGAFTVMHHASGESSSERVRHGDSQRADDRISSIMRSFWRQTSTLLIDA
jgi:hypothetical protein